jgi:ABC-type bacteriocin/lantibiotic exporter with double-glycine peptidase domain
MLVVRGELTLGQLVAAELVVNAALSGLTKFGKHIEGFYDFCAASNKLHSVRQIPLERADGELIRWKHNLPASVDVRNLNAGKEGLVDSFLKDVSFSIPAGGRVAICGQNGSGKSLLAELIFGLASPTTGALYLDGRNVEDISLVSLRSRITLVRTPQFFDGTLEDNLSVGRDNISRQDLRHLLRVLALETKMQKLDIDLQTKVTSSCRFFSYGEQLRLAIGRALLGNPGLVILDQTLDGIDEDSLQSVLDFLLDPDLPCSVLALTHDESIARQFKSAYNLDHGRLTPLSGTALPVPHVEGTHED